MHSISYVNCLVVLCLFVTLCKSYSGIISSDPENPGKCIYRGEEIAKGINNGPGVCKQLTCYEDGSILIEGCGKIILPHCKEGERKDATKPYPECCELIFKCKHENGTRYTMELSTFSGNNVTNTII